MKRMEHIGVDLGLVSQAAERTAAAAELGARVARLRFGLGGAAEMGPSFLATAREAVARLAEKGLKVLAVIDSDLTVAPDGMGAFVDRPQGPLARAWVEEMLGNAVDLARALSGSVEAWELLPLPNAGGTPRIHPVRWAALLEGLSAAIRDADPQARIVSGALLSDDRDDGAAYLDAALEAAGNRLPGDVLGLSLSIMAGGSPSEAILAAGLRDRVERLTQVLDRRGGDGAPIDLWVTSVGWDAQVVGEVNQATNTWTALSALSGHPRVIGVIWCGLTDDNPNAGGMASGLYQGSTALANQRRPAGNAFRDFSTYARQISMPAAAAALLRDEEPASPPAAEPVAATPEMGDAVASGATSAVKPEPQRPDRVDDSGGWTTAGVAGAAALAALGPLSEQDRQQATEATPLPWEEREPTAPPAEAPEPAADMPASEASLVEVPAVDMPVDEAPVVEAPVVAPSVDEAPLVEAPAAAPSAPVTAPAAPLGSGPLHFHIPNAREVLEAQGFSGDRLDAILEAVRRRYGSYQWLPAGDYHVDLEAEERAAEAPVAVVEMPVVEVPVPVVEVPVPVVETPAVVIETPAAEAPAAVVETPVVEAPAAVVEAPAAVIETPVVEAPVVETPAAVIDTPAAEAPVAVVEPPAIEDVAAVVEAPVIETPAPPVVPAIPSFAPTPALAPVAPLAPPPRPAITNQMMISALYRAGGGAWGLFDRAGLSLRDLAARRTQPYSGPPVSAMAGLSTDEQEAVQRELAGHSA